MAATAPLDLGGWAATRRDALDDVLGGRFGDAWPPRFQEACRYPLGTGGKRVRPLLTLAAGEAVAGADAGTHRDALLQAGAAVELIHTYSLVHDDLPAMDDDDERRGKPTVHRAYDEATAVLVGDALLTEAFAILAACPVPDAARVALVTELARAAGHVGMIGGQAADIAWTGGDLDALMTVHRGKTGALIRAAVVMGGVVAGATPAQADALARYGEAVGLAFQLADDVLDAEEDAGEDGPPSYVRLLGADETARRARELADRAVAAAETLPSPAALVALARFTVARDH